MATIRMLQFGTSSPAARNRYEELRDGRILIPTEASVDKLRTTLPDLDWVWIDDVGYLGWTISYIDGAVIWGRQWIITAPLIRGGEVCDLQSSDIDVAAVAARTWPLTAALLRDDEWDYTTPAKFALRLLAARNRSSALARH